ncbi:MAG: ATP-binding protein [Tolypothrix sp. T3-bin4]|nr:ATP-binding protein [Tolypothrix sp. T3-bin4]
MSDSIDDRPEGGMGIKIMSQLANELSYTRTPDHRNCLFIRKTYPSQGFDPSQDIQKSGVLEQSINFFLTRLNWLKYKHYRQQRGDTPLKKIHLQVNTELTAVNQVIDWYEQLEYLPISKTLWHQCLLMLVEGFTNAVRHAHKDLPLETPIELEVIVFNERLEIRIWDYGQPFDLEEKLNTLPGEVERPYQLEVNYTRTSISGIVY